MMQYFNPYIITHTDSIIFSNAIFSLLEAPMAAINPSGSYIIIWTVVISADLNPLVILQQRWFKYFFPHWRQYSYVSGTRYILYVSVRESIQWYFFSTYNAILYYSWHSFNHSKLSFCFCKNGHIWLTILPSPTANK